MPKCRNCGRTLRRFDSDICPYCGERDPFDKNYQTKDMTSFVKPISGVDDLPKSKKRSVAGLLCLFLGIFGAHFFYLGYKKNGLISILTTLILALGGGLALGLAFPQHLFLAFLPLIIVYLIYIIFSFRFFLSTDVKDAHGEYLR